MLAEVRSACWGGIPARPGHFPVLPQGQHPVLDQALTEAAVHPAGCRHGLSVELRRPTA